MWYNKGMTVGEIVKTEEYRSMVNDYREMCLWSFGDVLNPQSDVQLEMILNAIETYGDMYALKRAGRIRKWLSQNFNPKYSNGSPICA